MQLIVEVSIYIDSSTLIINVAAMLKRINYQNLFYFVKNEQKENVM